MRFSHSSVVSALIVGAQATSSTIAPLAVYPRQSIVEDSINSIPPGCKSACDPLFRLQERCATDINSMAKCVCVPEFVVHSDACSDCVVKESSTPQNETTATIGETLQTAIDGALQEFLSVCKDEVGVELTATVTSNSVAETIGPAAAAAALPTSGAPSAIDLSGSAAALLLTAATALTFLNA